VVVVVGKVATLLVKVELRAVVVVVVINQLL
jgi:hypothetical protein